MPIIDLTEFRRTLKDAASSVADTIPEKQEPVEVQEPAAPDVPEDARKIVFVGCIGDPIKAHQQSFVGNGKDDQGKERTEPRPVVIGYRLRWDGDEPLDFVLDSIVEPGSEVRTGITLEQSDAVRRVMIQPGEEFNVTRIALEVLLSQERFGHRAYFQAASEAAGMDIYVRCTGRPDTAEAKENPRFIKFNLRAANEDANRARKKGIDPRILAVRNYYVQSFGGYNPLLDRVPRGTQPLPEYEWFYGAYYPKPKQKAAPVREVHLDMDKLAAFISGIAE